MTKDEIAVGGTYTTKVGKNFIEVRIERENPKGGWEATSLGSGKPIRIRDAKSLRPAVAPDEGTSADSSSCLGSRARRQAAAMSGSAARRRSGRACGERRSDRGTPPGSQPACRRRPSLPLRSPRRRKLDRAGREEQAPIAATRTRQPAPLWRRAGEWVAGTRTSSIMMPLCSNLPLRPRGSGERRAA